MSGPLSAPLSWVTVCWTLALGRASVRLQVRPASESGSQQRFRVACPTDPPGGLPMRYLPLFIWLTLMPLGSVQAGVSECHAALRSYFECYWFSIQDEDPLLLEQAATAGDADAQVKLGVFHAAGEKVRKDDELALMWYERAAAQGQPSALLFLFEMAFRNRDVPAEKARAETLLKAAADAELPAAQIRYGEFLLHERGSPDYRAAAEWFTKAANQDYAMGQFYLAELYQVGLGVEKDQAASHRLYERAAQQSQKSAMRNLGYIYQQGKGVSADPVRAYMWFKLGDRPWIPSQLPNMAERMSQEQIEQANRLAVLCEDSGFQRCGYLH